MRPSPLALIALLSVALSLRTILCRPVVAGACYARRRGAAFRFRRPHLTATTGTGMSSSPSPSSPPRSRRSPTTPTIAKDTRNKPGNKRKLVQLRLVHETGSPFGFTRRTATTTATADGAGGTISSNRRRKEVTVNLPPAPGASAAAASSSADGGRCRRRPRRDDGDGDEKREGKAAAAATGGVLGGGDGDGDGGRGDRGESERTGDGKGGGGGGGATAGRRGGGGGADMGDDDAGGPVTVANDAVDHNGSAGGDGGDESTKPNTAASSSSAGGGTAPPSRSSASATANASSAAASDAPVVGRIRPASAPGDRFGSRWTVVDDVVLARTCDAVTTSGAKDEAIKVAAFDLDDTLLMWRCAGFPSAPEHYELRSRSAVEKLRSLSDQGFTIFIIANQGGIRSAFTGKIATRIRGLIDWFATELVDRPIWCVLSTNTKSGYHKPLPTMWDVVRRLLLRDRGGSAGGGPDIDLSQSFYVGDSAGSEDEPGVDRGFAGAVGLTFHTAEEYLGASDRSRLSAVGEDGAPYVPPPIEAQRARAAWSGGYLKGPVLLVLCGAQGSGKSTFSANLLKPFIGADEGGSSADGPASNPAKKAQDGGNGGEVGSAATNWVHLSQDTIRNGKPGKREQVERAAAEALGDGRSVVVDRMHLDPEQRAHFVAVGKEGGVPVHAVLLNPPLSEIERRVRGRTDHAAGVQGERGARLASSSVRRLVFPQYSEGFELIHVVTTVDEGADVVCDRYRRVTTSGLRPPRPMTSFALCSGTVSSSSPSSTLPVPMPSLALGTYRLGRRDAADVVARAIRLGWRAVDTAPTYRNEEEIGMGLLRENTGAKDDDEGDDDDDGDNRCFVIVKVPKKATDPSRVREELQDSLCNLGRDAADLLLLHWPCDAMEAGTLGAVWGEMENLKMEGLCRSLGVSNFSVSALRTLLPLCSNPATRPAVNQVERHPLLPQWDLVDFCAANDIVVQCHSPLGSGGGELLRHPTVMSVASASGLSTAQVLLQWNARHGMAVTTKCRSETHLRDAASCMRWDGEDDNDAAPSATQRRTLSASHMEMLDRLGFEDPLAPLRFVAPPFMFRRGCPYSWGDRPPKQQRGHG